MMGFTSIISELLTLPKIVLFWRLIFTVISRIVNPLTALDGYLNFFLLGFELSKDKTSALFILVLLNVLAKFMAYCG